MYAQNDFIDCVGNLADQAQIKLNVLEDEKFVNEHLIDMNKRVEIIKKFLKKECLNNGINESQYNKILQKLDEKVYTIDTANIKDDIVLLKINSNVAFTAITDEIYIWGKLMKEHDGEKLKEKIPFSLFHEAIHVVIGKKGGILPNFSDSSYYIEAITNYIAKEYAVKHKEQIDEKGISKFYPFGTKFITNCVTFLGNSDFLKDLFTKITYGKCNYQYVEEINQFGIIPQGIHMLTDFIFKKIQEIDPLSDIERKNVEIWIRYEVPQKIINTPLFNFFKNYNDNHPGASVFTWMQKKPFDEGKWENKLSSIA